MTNDAIFLVSDSGQLQRVEHQLYSSATRAEADQIFQMSLKYMERQRETP